MSGPLKLNPDALRHIGEALLDFSRVARLHNVEVGAYGDSRITYRSEEGEETVLRIDLTDSGLYIIDDRIGS
jgi:hypothetical protein